MYGNRFLRVLIAVAAILLAGACDVPILPSTGHMVTIGPSTHVIVLDPDASPSERHAAEVLRTHFEACMGAEIPVHDQGLTVEGAMIVLGCGPAARDLGVDPDPEGLGEQGYVLRTVSPHIVIAGTAEAGTLYGVYRFLEEYFGVRWYAPGVTRTPSHTQVIVFPVDRLVRPAFLWRHTSYAWPGKDADFLSRMGANNGSGGPDHPYGIQHSHDGRCHSYFRFISPGEFFDEHPEYFSEIGGVRIREETQLCLTNPDVLEIVTERMLARMESSPHVRQHNFSQMDYYNYCQCSECSAMNEMYGTKGGTQFWFVNRLAERTTEVFPDKLIGTLAYMYTEEPPVGLEIHPNAAVWLCHMYPSCDSHPVATCPLDADYKRRAEAWSELTGHLYIWHYVTDFTHYYNPFPNFRAMAADLRFYRDIGVEGIYLQGMGHGGGGGEFSLLRPYYGMKLLWDPDQNPEALRRDFLQGYYGPAWEPIEAYIELLHDKVEDDDVHMHLYTNPAQGYLTDEVVCAAEALFDQAEWEVRGDPIHLERVRVARMPLVHTRMFPRNGYDILGDRLVWRGEIASLWEILDFMERMERHGFVTVREVEGDPVTLLAATLMFSIDPEVVTIRNDRLSVEVVPMLAGRALRITDLQSGECVTAYDVRKSLFFPFGGGLEDRVGDLFRFYGWIEPASVLCLSETTITTRAPTFDGLELWRTLTLEADEPILHVESMITNPSDNPKETRLRNHLELDLGDVRETRVRFTSLAGQAIDQDMTGIIAGMREGEHFYDQDAPAGSWTFSGTKGLRLTQSFDNDQIDSTWIYSYPATLGEVEVELWTPRTELGPGESTTLRQEIEIRSVE